MAEVVFGVARLSYLVGRDCRLRVDFHVGRFVVEDAAVERGRVVVETSAGGGTESRDALQGALGQCPGDEGLGRRTIRDVDDAVGRRRQRTERRECATKTY